jgi:hypothetical protein
MDEIISPTRQTVEGFRGLPKNHRFWNAAQALPVELFRRIIRRQPTPFRHLTAQLRSGLQMARTQSKFHYTTFFVEGGFRA